MTEASMRKTWLGRNLALTVGLMLVGILTVLFDRSVDAQTPGAKTPTGAPNPDMKKASPAAPFSAAPGKKTTRRAEPPSVEPVVSIPQSLEIDKQIKAKWEENKIKPSSLCSDNEFIRRASLDIIGRIPSSDEIALFLKDPPPNRRSILIDRLLDHDKYAENWSNNWTTWLMTRTGNQIYHEQMQVWLEEQFSKKDRGWDKIVYDLVTATGENNDNGAVNFILSHLGEQTPQAKIPDEGPFNYIPITSRTTKMFLGLQTQCTQCHDHPFNPQWKQRHFWGINAFFRQVQRQGNPAMNQRQRNMAPPKLGLADNLRFNESEILYYEDRKAVVKATRPTYLDGSKVSKTETLGGKTRREQLAAFIIQDPSFAKAYVNRMWFLLLGRGMTVNGKDFDDFGEHNAETHPELLEYLAKEFRDPKYGNHDPRQLIRWICNSRPYNLSAVANSTNDKTDAEPFFARMQLKSMSPEQLFESLWISTYANPNAKTKRSREERKQDREKWMSQLVVNFGDDEGNETSFNGTVIQALLLMNGNEINNAINDPNGPVAASLDKQSFETALDQLFLATVSRKPTTEEVNQIKKDVEPVLLKGRVNKDKAFWEKVCQDVFWALLNSSEFILNH